MSIDPTNTFCISFSTKECPGLLVAVQVTIEKKFLRNDEEVIRVDLINHPLYSALEKYVLANLKNSRDGKTPKSS